MPHTVTLDPTVLAAIAIVIAGWGAIQAVLKGHRDRTVEFLRLQLGEAQKEIHKLQGQVELLERAGFASIHSDHQLILQELRGMKRE